MIPYQIRRANIDDLAQLIALWQGVELPVTDLEKRLTEFQVAEKEGKIVAAIGLKIHQHEGLLHSESFSDFGEADAIRPLLWERLERVAANHGLYRIWTQETAPFWKRAAFRQPTSEQLNQRPKNFDHEEKSDWLIAQLKDVAAAPINIDKEFERFKESERARTEEIMSQARWLKGLATVIAIIVFAFAMIVLFKFVFFKRRTAQGDTKVEFAQQGARPSGRFSENGALQEEVFRSVVRRNRSNLKIARLAKPSPYSDFFAGASAAAFRFRKVFNSSTTEL